VKGKKEMHKETESAQVNMREMWEVKNIHICTYVCMYVHKRTQTEERSQQERIGLCTYTHM
jgi:hypothetical protein